MKTRNESGETNFMTATAKTDANLSSFRYESPGTEHKNLTFSQFCGDSYETDVEGRFIEYLQHCFRTYNYLVVIGRSGS